MANIETLRINRKFDMNQSHLKPKPGTFMALVLLAIYIMVLVSVSTNCFGQILCANDCFNIVSHPDITGNVGDDLNLTNGEYSTQIVDFDVVAHGIPIKYFRTYQSRRSPTLSSVGLRWNHSFEMRVSRAGIGVDVTMEDGSVENYVYDGHEYSNMMVFKPGNLKGVYGILTYYTTTDTYELKRKNKLTYIFSRVGTLYWLERIIDTNGNQIVLKYLSQKLDGIYARRNGEADVQAMKVLGFEYNTHGMISTVKLYGNDGNVAKKIEYDHDALYYAYLTGVKYPRYFATPTGDPNDVASYTYSQYTDHPDDYTWTTQLALSRIQDVRSPKGYTDLQIVYSSISLGQVKALKAPHGTGGTMITIGEITNWTTNERTYREARGYSKTVTVDGNYSVRTETDALGHTEYYDLDNNLNRTAYTDKKGNITRYVYDNLGNTTSITNATGDVTGYEYETQKDIFSYVSKVITPWGTGSSRVTSNNYYETNTGNLTLTVDALGYQTHYTYNTFGQVLTITDARGFTTTYDYYTDDNSGHGKGNLKSVTRQIDPARNTYTEFEYDVLNRVIKTKEQVDTGNFRITKNTYENDLKGDRIVKVELLNATGTTVLTTAQYEYDSNGNKTKVTDANEKETFYIYDAADRLLEVDTPFGTGSARITTKYEYDLQDNRTKLIDAKGKETTYTYDELNRLATVTDATTHQTSYSYDEVGNIHTKTDGKGQTTTYTYDSLNRLMSDGIVGYTYDKAGNRLTMIKDGNTTYYQYNALNRLTEVTLPDGNTTDYTYDGIGNRLTMKMKGIGDGDTVTYEYFRNGWLKSVTDHCGSVTSYDYNLIGNRTSMTYPNGVVTNYTYTSDIYRLASSTSTNSSGVTLAFQNYSSYDNVGNILTRVDDNGTTTYQYDNLYQLTHVAYPNTNTTDYEYDEAGNRKRMVETGSSVVTTDYTCNDANELTQFGSTTIDYDNNGNETRKGTKYYNWNTKNQLTSVTGFANNISYEYDGDGRRTKKIVGSAETRYYYDGANCVAEADDTGSLKAVYTHGAELISKKDSSGLLYFLYDNIGNTVATVSSNASIVTRYEYDAFGKVRSESPSGDIRNTNKFVGGHGIVDDSGDDGLIYMRARYYDTETGRFISRDPIGITSGLNLYYYAYNNRASRKALYQLGS